MSSPRITSVAPAPGLGMTAAQPADTVPPNLWDPVVRLTHWGIAVAVLLNALVTEGGSLIGPSEARFSAFPPNPFAALRHLGDLARGRPREHRSHNPAGALMAYALWVTLATLIATGLILTGGSTPMQVARDKAAVASGDWSALIKKGESSDEDASFRHTAGEIHEVAANLLLLFAVLHVAGVFVESRALKRNLVAPMLLGKGNPPR
jgi:cytochrome b